MPQTLERQRKCNHGTIKRTGITFKKISCYMRFFANQVVDGLLLKMLKHFEVMSNIFQFSHIKKRLNRFTYITLAKKL